jgi:long-chain fatty acid transport protein
MWSQSVLASGFVVARFGGEHGHPTTQNPTALYYNPAALSLGKGYRIFVDGTLAYRSVDYTRPLSALSKPGLGTPDQLSLANSGTAQLRNWAGAPFIGFASDFGIPNLTIAAGFYAPFGGGASWNNNANITGDLKAQHPGIEEGVQRWWSIDSTLKVLYTSLGASYQVHPYFSFGLSLNLVSTQLDTIRARNPDGTDDLFYPNGKLKEGRSYISVSGQDLSVGGGLLFTPSKQWKIGVSYQSQPGFGENRLKGKLYTALNDGPLSDPSDVGLLQSIPAVTRFGVTWNPTEQSELRLFGDYVQWSQFDRQCLLSEPDATCDIEPEGQVIGTSPVVLNIYKNWQDAFGVRAGGSYWFTPKMEVYVGGGYDGNAAPDQGVDPSLFDMDKLTAAAGFKWSIFSSKDSTLKLAFTYTQVFYKTRTIDLTVDMFDTPTNGYKGASKGPSPAGKYEQSIGVGNLNVEYQF